MAGMAEQLQVAQGELPTVEARASREANTVMCIATRADAVQLEVLHSPAELAAAAERGEKSRPSLPRPDDLSL